MKSKTYYGEYTLKHWIDLILSKNIKLPEYQRSFVWNEKDVRRMIHSLAEGQFIQPVTIALYREKDGSGTNLILDGQQRLTSILLFYLGYMPNKEMFSESTHLATEDDSLTDDPKDADSPKGPIGWTFQQLLNNQSDTTETIHDVIDRLPKDKYMPFHIELKEYPNIESFVENTFLGFSYIVPEAAQVSEMQQFFSKLFRNMNYLGMKLSALESRRSLYYLNTDYVRFFDGETTEGDDILCGIKIVENVTSADIDIVRYLAILSQYTILQRSDRVLVGYSAYSSRENFYADYVSYIVGLEQSERTDKFDDFNIKTRFPDNCWKERFTAIRSLISANCNKFTLDHQKNAFPSWIDADYWLFGLIYWMLFEGKTISFTDELAKEISSEINKLKKDTNYTKSPNRLGNLRARLQSSIDIYKRYAE